MTILRIPAVCWYHGTPKRSRVAKSVPAWFAVPAEIPDIASSDVDGRISIRWNETGSTTEMPVVGGRAMYPILSRVKGVVHRLDAASFEKRIDGLGTNRAPLAKSLAILIDPSADRIADDPTDLLIEKVEPECLVLDQFKNPDWSTRDEAEAYARSVAAEMVLIDGVIHHALAEPVHEYDIANKTRTTTMRRLSSWNEDHRGKVLARVDRMATDGNAFDEGVEIEGDVDAVRWRFRDADANALQIARYFFEDEHLCDFASFHGGLGRIRENAAGVAEDRPDAAASLVDAADEILKVEPAALVTGRMDMTAILAATERVRASVRLVRSIRHAQEIDHATSLRP